MTSTILVTLRFLCDRCDAAIGVRLLERATPKALAWSSLANRPRLMCPGCGFELASIEERKAIGAAREPMRREASQRHSAAEHARAMAELRPCSSCGHSFRSHSWKNGCDGGDNADDCDCERFTEVLS
jgi:ribosomal protein L32